MRVLVAILSRTGAINASYTALQSYLTEHPNPSHTLHFITIVGCRSAVHAHNEATRAFFTSTEPYDALWLWADDMIISPASLGALDIEADLVACGVWNWFESDRLVVTMSAIHRGGDSFEFLKTHPSALPYRIDACGTGGLLIRRHVLLDTRMHLTTHNDLPILWTDEYAPDFKRTRGHDLPFTHRATQLGYTLVVAPNFPADHIKSIPLSHVYDFGIRSRRMGFEMGREFQRCVDRTSHTGMAPLTLVLIQGVSGKRNELDRACLMHRFSQFVRFPDARFYTVVAAPTPHDAHAITHDIPDIISIVYDGPTLAGKLQACVTRARELAPHALITTGSDNICTTSMLNMFIDVFKKRQAHVLFPTSLYLAELDGTWNFFPGYDGFNRGHGAFAYLDAAVLEYLDWTLWDEHHPSLALDALLKDRIRSSHLTFHFIPPDAPVGVFDVRNVHTLSPTSAYPLAPPPHDPRMMFGDISRLLAAARSTSHGEETHAPQR